MGSYRRGVVGLAKVAIDTAGGGGVENTAILLLEEVGPGSLGYLVGSASMDIHDWVPEAVIHVSERLVPQDTGVVDNNVDTAKGINGGLHDSIAILSGELGTNSLASHLLDLIDNIIRVDEIVNNDRSAMLGKCQAISTADTSTATGDEGDTPSEVNLLPLLIGSELGRLLKEGKEVVRPAGVLGVREIDDLVPLLQNSTGGVGLIALEELTTGALPTELGDVATANLKDGAGLASVALMHEDGNKGNNPLGLHKRKKVRGHDCLGHAASGNRCNDVGNDVVLGTLLRKSLSKADLGKFGGRVVGLAKIAEQTGSGSSVDNATELLFAEVWPGGTSRLVGTLDVDLEDQVPILVLHILEADIAEDTGIVDEDIDAAERLDGSFDNLVAILDAVVVGHSLAARGLDLVYYDIGCLWKEGEAVRTMLGR